MRFCLVQSVSKLRTWGLRIDFLCDMAQHYSTVSYDRVKMHTVQSPAVSKNGRERDRVKEKRKEGEQENGAQESLRQR